LLCWQ